MLSALVSGGCEEASRYDQASEANPFPGWGQLRGQTSSVTYPIPRQVARFDLKSAGGDSGNRTRDRGFAVRACLFVTVRRRPFRIQI